MLPSKHISYGLIICLFFFIILPYGNVFPYIIIFLSSVLIDIDHYFPYIIKGRFNLIRNYKEQIILSKKLGKLSKEEKRKLRKTHFIFHGIEFVALLIFLSSFNKIFFFIFLGVILHLFLDFIDLIKQKEPLYIKISQIYVFISNKRKTPM
jgi:membrane-bound metal-dependent hydrolase YbcI (DUF457 family)